MSLSAMAWAKRQTAGGVAAKAVLMTLADYADEAGTCWPSQAMIARECELSDRSVRDQLAKLESAGLLSREVRRRPDGTQASDRFHLPLNSRNDVPPARNDVPHDSRNDLPPVRKDVPVSALNSRNDVPQQPERRSTLATLDPPTDPPSCVVERASASNDLDWPESLPPSRAYLDRLKSALFEAAGEAINETSPNIHVLAPILALGRPGAGPPCELQADVLGAIRATAMRQRRQSVASWAFFARPCQDARDRRLAGAGAAQVVDLSRPGRSITERLAAEQAEASRLTDEILERRRGHQS